MRDQSALTSIVSPETRLKVIRSGPGNLAIWRIGLDIPRKRIREGLLGRYRQR